MNRQLEVIMNRNIRPTIRVIFLLIAIFALFNQGCVSVNIGEKAGERSVGVIASPPASPFEALSGIQADGAWQNKKNGNSISYLSICNDPADPTIETATREMLADFKNAKPVRTQTIQFNGREALDTEVEGSAEGVSTHVRAVVFKKNGCIYTLSYVGLSRAFEEDRLKFEQFLKGFEAP